jgi:DNA polymerase III subunit epsilon
MTDQLTLNLDNEQQPSQDQPSMNLQLTKPLAIFDLETTGINIGSDRILEIAIIRIMPGGNVQKKRKLLNPEMPIPPAATEVHGITNEMVKDAPTFKQAANEIRQFIDGCDLAGYNSNRFDVPILMEEFLRSGIEMDLKTTKLVDVQRIFHQMEQ